MRIGILSQWFDPEPGGGAVPGVLAKGLRAQGHDVRVLTGFPNYPSGEIYAGYRQRLRHLERPIPGLAVRRVPLFANHDGKAINRAANYLSFAASAAMQSAHLAGADAMWVYNSPATVGPVANLLRRRHGVPFLLHIMDVWPDSVLESGMLASSRGRAVTERALTALVELTYRSASLVAVTSPGQLQMLHNRGVSAQQLRYVPVWADERLFFPRAADRSFLPEVAQRASLVLMYAGAMGHVQRLDVAVRAAADAREAGVHLVMVGSGIAEQGLRELSADLGAENVHFLGSYPPQAMGVLSAAADVHLVSLADTPLLRVTMPSKVLAIMASGRPIVACCRGDAADAVVNAGAGVAVMPGDVAALTDVLRELADDTAVLREWGEASRRCYERHFAKAQALSRVESLLAEIAR